MEREAWNAFAKLRTKDRGSMNLPTARSTQSLARFAPVALRVVLGIIFLTHGCIKLAHMERAIHSFASLGIPLANIAAPAITALEVAGGIALILGLLSRIFALLLIIEMIIAIVTARAKAGFIGGWEFELALIAGLVALVLAGPGALSLARNKETLLA